MESLWCRLRLCHAFHGYDNHFESLIISWHNHEFLITFNSRILSEEKLIRLNPHISLVFIWNMVKGWHSNRNTRNWAQKLLGRRIYATRTLTNDQINLLSLQILRCNLDIWAYTGLGGRNFNSFFISNAICDLEVLLNLHICHLRIEGTVVIERGGRPSGRVLTAIHLLLCIELVETTYQRKRSRNTLVVQLI